SGLPPVRRTIPQHWPAWAVPHGPRRPAHGSRRGLMDSRRAAINYTGGPPVSGPAQDVAQPMSRLSAVAEAPAVEATTPSSMRWNVRVVRARLRLVTALVMLAFVICHLVSHITLLISLPFADHALALLMAPWRTGIGTALLLAAASVHYVNALW